MGTHNICLYKEIDKKYTSCNLNTCPAEGICPAFAISVDPDQLALASEEANLSGSALFVIKYVNVYQQPKSSNLIG